MSVQKGLKLKTSKGERGGGAIIWMVSKIYWMMGKMS